MECGETGPDEHDDEYLPDLYKAQGEQTTRTAVVPAISASAAIMTCLRFQRSTYAPAMGERSIWGNSAAIEATASTVADPVCIVRYQTSANWTSRMGCPAYLLSRANDGGHGPYASRSEVAESFEEDGHGEAPVACAGVILPGGRSFAPCPVLSCHPSRSLSGPFGESVRIGDRTATGEARKCGRRDLNPSFKLGKLK